MSSKFLHNHYEKVILATLLILFCGVLLFQTKMIQENRSSDVKDIVNKPEPAVDVEVQDYDKLTEFQKSTVFSSGIDPWVAWNKKNNADAKDYSDMMTTAPMALCPYCFNLISKDAFPAPLKKDATKEEIELAKKNSKSCPYCKKALVPPTPEQAAKADKKADEEPVIVNYDINDNGIDDRIESEEYGMTVKENVNQLDEDIDKDGFTCKEEIAAKTKPNDPKSHPLLVTKLFLNGDPSNVSFEDLVNNDITDSAHKVKTIRIVGNDTMVREGGKAATLAVQVIDHTGNANIHYVKMGAYIPYYKADSIAKQKNANAGMSNFRFVRIIPGKDMKSHVFVLQKGDLELNAKADRAIGTPFYTVKFEHVLHPDGIEVNSNTLFEIGTNETNREKYTVTQVNREKHCVVLTADDKDKKQYTITFKPAEKNAAEPEATEQNEEE